MKTQIIELHKNIFLETKKKALSLLKSSSTLLNKYQKDQKKFANRPFIRSNTEELINSAKNSNVIFLGDFHTFDQHSKNLNKLLNSLISKERKIILGLEMVFRTHQKYIDAFLNNDITEMEFLESINYHHSWRFPWAHYKSIFDLAKKYKIQVIGLNSNGTLTERDHIAAQIIIEHLENRPNFQFLVLYGELHIVPNKIPKLVKNLGQDILGKQLSCSIIHQNLDEVYWKLKGQAWPTTIIKFNKSEYTLISSPPWIKYESMIYWFENLGDDPEFDIHEYLIENGLKIFSSNTNHNFLLMSDQIIKAMSLEKMISTDIDDFNLYDHTNIDYVDTQISAINNLDVRKLLKHLLLTNRTFSLPNKKYYCSNYSINRLSYLVGHHIFQLFLTKNNLELYQLLEDFHDKQTLIILTRLYMVSYLASKIINPHKKCDLYLDLKQKMNSKTITSIDKKNIRKSIEFIDSDIRKIISLKNYDTISQNKIAKITGHFLGSLLFEHCRKISYKQALSLIHNFLFNLDFSPEFFYQTKKYLTSNTDYKKSKKTFF